MTAPHWVYTHIDAAGNALYVGCSNNVANRLRTHSSSSSWYERIADVAAIGPFEKAEALRIEAEIIAELDPPHNVRWTPRDPRNRENRPKVVTRVPPYLNLVRGPRVTHWAYEFGPRGYRSVCGTFDATSRDLLRTDEMATCKSCIAFVGRPDSQVVA